MFSGRNDAEMTVKTLKKLRITSLSSFLTVFFFFYVDLSKTILDNISCHLHNDCEIANTIHN